MDLARGKFAGGVLAGALCLAASGHGQAPGPELKIVNYVQLGEVVAQQRGKVVLIDLWHNG